MSMNDYERGRRDALLRLAEYIEQVTPGPDAAWELRDLAARARAEAAGQRTGT